jgi:lipopolysaccharide/colanic/teichoic acid biosynthesis glycosyltransferase
MKRLLDIILALILLPLALPISLGAMVVLAIEIGANPIFTQTRVGRHKRPFTIYKLRTMKSDTRDAASHEVKPGQITRVGRVIRRVKFDELPQIINVLMGDMSFVGPRPCLPIQEELVSERERRGIYELRPGITGPAQLAGIDMSEPARLAKADEAYKSGWSLTRDISILMRTFLGMGSGDAATAAEPR